MSFLEDAYESVLFISREVYIYQIGPRPSAEGYKASDWVALSPLWTGRLRVIEIIDSSNDSSKVEIRLEDSNTGELFAKVPYQPTPKDSHGGIEPVIDSSRYFVLRLVDEASGSKAFLGLGFTERSESFDFNVAIQDWSKRESTPSLSSSASSASSSSQPIRDYSLKAGETIKIEVGGKVLGGGANSNSKKPLTGKPFMLPPPPPAANRRRD